MKLKMRIQMSKVLLIIILAQFAKNLSIKIKYYIAINAKIIYVMIVK